MHLVRVRVRVWFRGRDKVRVRARVRVRAWVGGGTLVDTKRNVARPVS